MPSTPFDVIVFDFDGTLVCSTAVKRQTFFEVFPPQCAPAVEAVLAHDPDGSRHRAIPEMIDEALRMQLDVSGLAASDLIAAYGARCDSAVASAPAMPGAAAVLRQVSAQVPTYIASVTPEAELRAQLTRRGWLGLVREAFGFPHGKAEVVARLIARHAIPARRLLVVGDGINDRQAADINGCLFHLVDDSAALSRIPGLGSGTHA